MKRHIEDRDEDFEIIDGRPVLKDGRAFRVPVTLMDSAQRQVRQHFDNSVFTRITDIEGSLVGLHRPGFRIPTGGSEADQMLRDGINDYAEAAYADYVDGLQTAYRDAPPLSGQPRGAQEFDTCTVRGPEYPNDQGAPGQLRMQSGKLTCVPDQPRATDKSIGREAYIAAITSAWRRA